jgi:hypothetical protein
MRKFYRRESRFLWFVLMAAVLVAGCAAPNKYVMNNPPTTDVHRFASIEVAPVTTDDITKYDVSPITPAILRTAIIAEIQKVGIYRNVGLEFDYSEAVLQVQPKIVQFVKGDRAERYFVGFGAGKAHLDVVCRFVNKETQSLIAEGIFTAEVEGGMFGGDADQQTMAENVAGQVAKFLKKGQ